MPKTTFVRVRIRALSAWHTGIWQGHDGERDSKKVRKLGTGPAISANSVTGALRSHIGESAALDLLGGGREVIKDGKPSPEFVASPWIVLGVVTGSASKTETRQHTPIDRGRRAAGTGGLHRIQEVQPNRSNEGSDVTLYLKLEDGEPEAMLNQLASWRPTLGGLVSTGMGQAKVTEVKHRTIEFDFKQPKQFVDAVKQLAHGADGIDALLDEDDDQAKPLGTTGCLKAKGTPTLLEAKLSVPLLSKQKEDDQKRFQGSRWKGLIRSRIEYIGRTLGKPVCGVGIRVARDEQGEPQFTHDAKHWAGDTCDVCQVLGSAEVGVSLWSFGVSEFPDHQVDSRYAHRIAINRFTGGVLETAQGGALFEQHYWPEVKLTLTIKQIAEAPDEAKAAAKWVARALLHVLADINDGLVGIGGKSGIGMGTAEIEELTLSDEFCSIAEVENDIGLKQIARLSVLEGEE